MGIKYRKALFIVVFAKVNKKIEYLILKRKLHWTGWEFTKGGKRFFETDKMTIKRELKEELGKVKILKIKKFRERGRYKYREEFLDRPGIAGQTFKLYAVEIVKQKIKIDNYEHSDYKWFTFKEAMKKLTWPNQRKCLKIVENWLKE